MYYESTPYPDWFQIEVGFMFYFGGNLNIITEINEPLKYFKTYYRICYRTEYCSFREDDYRWPINDGGGWSYYPIDQPPEL